MVARFAMKLKLALYAAGIIIMILAYSGCGTATTSNQPQGPITIGISLSLSGDFSADGKYFQQGYQLWADTVNKSGGLLGRQVKLIILSDASSPTQVATNYQTLINVDHVDLVFGPFSTLLTKASDVIAHRFGYAMLEGAGGGPSVFTQGLNNVFDVSLPVANNLVSFAQYILSLPASSRPKTAAYATEDDPFTQPQVDIARHLLEQGGIKTAYYTVYPAETIDFTPYANRVIASGAQVDVFGTLLPDITAFMLAFKQQHYNPQALIATAGPDQGTQFLSAIGGTKSAEGVFVPNGGWYPQVNNYQNAAMVQAYLKQYGGTDASMSSDIAEAYAVGQVAQQAITKIGSLDNSKLITELHSDTFNSVQGSVKFDSTGQNTTATAYLFQWQQGSLIPVYPASVAGSAKPEFPKPQWP